MSGNITAVADDEPWVCMWDNETCKMEDWGTRLIDTEYISQPFLQWGNILVIFWTLLIAYSSRWVFSQPFMMYDKATKPARVAARKERRDKRKAHRRRMRKLKAKALTVGGGLAAAVKLAKAQAEEGNADEDFGEAKGGDGSRNKPDTESLNAVDVVVSDGTATVDGFAVFRSFDSQIVQGDNKAMGLLYAGFVVSLMLACSGPRSPVDYDDLPLDSFVDFLLYSIISYVLLCMSIVVQSKLLLYKVDVRKSLLQGNLSTAVTLAGICLATSINLNASMMGKPGQNFGDTIGATVLFFVLGQVSVLIFGWIFQLITKYDDQQQCRKGNAAAGIKWASNLVALGIVSSSPIKKTSELSSFGLFVTMGGFFLLVLDFLVSYLVVPGNVQQEIVKDRNWGYALIAASILLSAALSIDALLIDLPCPGSDAYDKMMAAQVVPGEIVTNSTA